MKERSRKNQSNLKQEIIEKDRKRSPNKTMSLKNWTLRVSKNSEIRRDNLSEFRQLKEHS